MGRERRWFRSAGPNRILVPFYPPPQNRDLALQGQDAQLWLMTTAGPVLPLSCHSTPHPIPLPQMATLQGSCLILLVKYVLLLNYPLALKSDRRSEFESQLYHLQNVLTAWSKLLHLSFTYQSGIKYDDLYNVPSIGAGMQEVLNKHRLLSLSTYPLENLGFQPELRTPSASMTLHFK